MIFAQIFPVIISLSPLVKCRFAPITMKPCKKDNYCYNHGVAMINIISVPVSLSTYIIYCTSPN